MKAILSIFLCLCMLFPLSPHSHSQASESRQFEIVVGAIKAAYDIYKGVSSFSDPTTEELLNQAVAEIVAEMRLLYAEDLVAEVNGLQLSFHRYIEMPSESDRASLLRDADSVSARLENIIYIGDYSEVYGIALPYNFLVSLRAAVMSQSGYSKELIAQDVFDPAIRANRILLGAMMCYSQRTDQGVLFVHNVSYYPPDGKLWLYYAWNESGKSLMENAVYTGVLDSNIRALSESQSQFCEEISNNMVIFRWTTAGPPYNTKNLPDACEPSFGTGCLYRGFGAYDPPFVGMFCTQITESAEPSDTTWYDNYLCSSRPLGMRWSSAGPIPNMDCVKWHESRESDSTTWYDNFLCFPPESTALYDFAWSSAGQISGMYCVQIYESAEPASTSWHDNFFCYRPR